MKKRPVEGKGESGRLANRIGWAGIILDEIDTWRLDGSAQLAIWKTRREARRRYERVRKVEIRFAPARSGRARA